MTAPSDFSLPGLGASLFNLYGFVLPIVLCTAWASLAFWDLGRRRELSSATSTGWAALIILVPFVGALAYFAFGNSQIPGNVRAIVAAGGLGLYATVLLLSSLFGGVT